MTWWFINVMISQHMTCSYKTGGLQIKTSKCLLICWLKSKGWLIHYTLSYSAHTFLGTYSFYSWHLFISFLGTYSSHFLAINQPFLLIYLQLVIGTSRYKREHWSVVFSPRLAFPKGCNLRVYCSWWYQPTAEFLSVSPDPIGTEVRRLLWVDI